MNEMSPRPPEPTFGSGLYEGIAADGLVDLVRAGLALNGTGLLVDPGAGTGQLARTLRPFFKRVAAVDPEPDMAGYGRTRTEREDDGIEWRLVRAQDPCPGAS